MKLLIQNDFFDDNIIEELRKIALSLDYTTHQQMRQESGSSSGWMGARTKKLTSYDKFFLYSSEQKIFKALKDFFGFEKSKITSFFHLTFEETKKEKGFLHGRYHKDSTCSYAGLVYLSPQPSLNSGTSILDEKNNKLIHVDNVYNRMVAYPADCIHAVSDVFGNTKETGRMTLTFFIHDKDIHIDNGNPK